MEEAYIIRIGGEKISASGHFLLLVGDHHYDAEYIENLLINPFSRYLFDEDIQGNVKITIDDIDAENMPYALTCTYEEIV